MAVYLSPEKRKEIYKEFGGTEENSGSVASQIALFTYRIKELSEHLKIHRKDHSCRRSLLQLVGKRKRLLNYMSREDIEAYRALIEKLGLRK